MSARMAMQQAAPSRNNKRKQPPQLRFEMAAPSPSAADKKAPMAPSLCFSDIIQRPPPPAASASASTLRKAAAPLPPALQEQRHALATKSIVFDADWALARAVVDNQRAKIFHAHASTLVQNLLDHAEGEWPERTSICCWWCSAGFLGVPVVIPSRYEPRKPRPFTGAFGNFCSFNCAAAYNLALRDSRVSARSEALAVLRAKVFGEPLSKIVPAPPRQALRMFGGHLEHHEFRGGFDVISSRREGDAQRPTRCMLLHRMICVEFDRMLVCHGDGGMTTENGAAPPPPRLASSLELS